MMAVFTIQSPDGRKIKIEAADEATAMRGAQEWAASNPAAPAPSQEGRIPIISDFNDFSNAFRTGATQGMTFHFADELQAGVEAPFRAIGDTFSGKGFDLGRSFNEGLQNVRGVTGQMTAKNEGAALAGDVVGSLVAGGGLAKGGFTLMNAAKPTVASMAGRGALEGAAYGAVSGFGRSEADSVEGRGRDALTGGILGGVAGGALGGVGGKLAERAGRKAVPTVQQLDDAAGLKYEAARASGVVAPQQGTQAISATIRKIAVDEGLISPTGRLDTSRPMIAEALRTFQDYSKGTMTVPQMQSVRRKLTDAAGSPTPGERRIAMKMLEEFDNFTSKLAPQLAEGNAIYHQMKKGELIEKTIELAGSRAGQFSGSGFENALRTEFRALERQIIKGELKGLSQAEIDAITKVARGGVPENIARYIGKFAPTGVVPFMGGAVPAVVGTATGNPVLGMAASLGLMGAGAAGRSAATYMTSRNAQIAAELARNGGQAVQGMISPQQQAIAQALIAGSGNQMGRVPQSRMLPTF
jgi:hypothetical protein